MIMGPQVPSPAAAELVDALGERQCVLVTCATGFIGSRLVEALSAAGHDVIVLTRDPARAMTLRPPFRLVTGLDQIAADTRIEAVVNLAGEPIATNAWTRTRRRRILASRLRVTRDVLRLIARLAAPPKVLVSGSAVGWYGSWGDETLTEFDGGKSSFLHRVCEAWEQAAHRGWQYGVRVVRLRTGTVLGRDGGLLARLVTPFRLGLGGPFGTGTQWMSWIERDDLVRLIAHAIASPALSGPLNATAPEPVRNAAFARLLAAALDRPAAVRVPAALLRGLAGKLADELLLAGQRIIPDKAEATGFKFRHRTLASALEAILGEPRGMATGRLAPPLGARP